MPVNRIRGAIKRFAPYIQSGYRAARMVNNWNKSRMQTKMNRKLRIASYGVTQQHDARVTYRRKRMPRYKRKRWTAFKKKVQAVVQSNLATISKVANSTVYCATYAPVSTSNQAYAVVHLYGKCGKTNTGGISDIEVGQRDLRDLFGFNEANVANKVHFKAGILDLTMTNKTINSAGTATGTLEVDLYHIIYRGNSTQRIGLTNVFDEAAQATTGSMTLSNRGVTPFELPEASSIGNYKIIKKTKLFIGYGQTATYQIRDPKNYFVDTAEIFQGMTTSTSETSFCHAPMTQSLLVVAKTCPGFDVNPNLVIGASRAYHYTILESNQPSEGYLVPTS